jgi:hypothetical protein
MASARCRISRVNMGTEQWAGNFLIAVNVVRRVILIA